jgi:hypothetical protein
MGLELTTAQIERWLLEVRTLSPAQFSRKAKQLSQEFGNIFLTLEWRGKTVLEWEYERPSNTIERAKDSFQVLQNYFLDVLHLDAFTFAQTMMSHSLFNAIDDDTLKKDLLRFLLSLWTTPWITTCRGREAILEFCANPLQYAPRQFSHPLVQEFLNDFEQMIETDLYVTVQRQITLSPELYQSLLQNLFDALSLSPSISHLDLMEQ